MTKKDYTAIAQILSETYPVDSEAAATWAEIRDKLADLFAADNPSFNRQKFIDATEQPEAKHT